MSDSSVMAEKKLMILYLIYQMEIPMLLSEIQKFALFDDRMDYMSFSQYLSELTQANLIDKNKDRDKNMSVYTLTDEGEQILNLFMRSMSESARNDVINYVSKNKKRIRREFNVTSNTFYNGENNHLVKCGVYEDGLPLMELTVSVVSAEQAKIVAKNWKEHVNELYSGLMTTLIDDGTSPEFSNAFINSIKSVKDKIKNKIAEED